MNRFASAVTLCILMTTPALAAELRIDRPMQIPQTFTAPEKPTMTLLEPAIFCPVLMCHGTCNHREGPCLLRTFDNLLTAASTGCCADSGKPSHDQCGSHDCCE